MADANDQNTAQDGPVWNPWTSGTPPTDSSAGETTSGPSTSEPAGTSVSPTPPPWPVDFKSPMPTNVSNLTETKEDSTPVAEAQDLSAGEAVPEQKPTLEPIEDGKHTQVLEILKRIEEKVDKLKAT